MVILDPRSGSRPQRLAYLMRVVKAEQPLSIFTVKGERVCKAMGTFD
jgi:hypothetical protein